MAIRRLAFYQLTLIAVFKQAARRAARLVLIIIIILIKLFFYHDFAAGVDSHFKVFFGRIEHGLGHLADN